MTTYGNFPGVEVETAGGGITAVLLGDEDNLVIFGEADYDRDGQNVQDDGLSADTADGLDSNSTTTSVETPEQIGARNEADTIFGDDTELANAMKDALANGANIDFLYGVAPERYIRQETRAGQDSGSTSPLPDRPIVEDPDEVTFKDDDGNTTEFEVIFTYETGTPTVPSKTETVVINPFTGEFAASAAPTNTEFTVDYRSLDYSNAFSVSAVKNIVNEEESGVYVPLTESDEVSSSLQTEVQTLRSDYQMVKGVVPAEPNDTERIEDSNNDLQRFDARYNTSNYDTDANQSVDDDAIFKFAPARQEDVVETISGGVGGLFAGNTINDPVYNEPLNGFQSLEQSLSLSEANDLRDPNNIIPVRQAGSIRVKDNLSTSTSTDWERDFWRRRIADRVILIAKAVGDAIIGRINDDNTRNAAQRQIESQMRGLVDQRLIRPNQSDSNNWFVDVYEDSNNANEVNIDIGFTPYGIVKRVDVSVTINT